MVLPEREVRFQWIPNRLYYLNSVDIESSVLILNTVSENREGFMRGEYEGAREACREMHLLGFPSEQDFGNMVHSNMIVNCPVTFDDIKNAKLIFGPYVTSLKGKSVRRKPDSIVMDYAEIPREIIESCKELEVLTDIIFVKKLLFLSIISRVLKFTTI